MDITIISENKAMKTVMEYTITLSEQHFASYNMEVRITSFYIMLCYQITSIDTVA